MSSEREGVLKKISAQEILMERLRSQLHETLRKAEVEEVALPAVLDEEEQLDCGGGAVKAGKKASKGSGKRRASKDTDKEDEEESLVFSSELDLRWRGSTTTLRGSGSSAPDGASGSVSGSRRSRGVESAEGSAGSMHFSESDNPVVLRDSERVGMVDLSSLRAIVGSDRHEVQVEKEKSLAKDIAELIAELESIQPNMHAGEKYEGVVERLKDCASDLDNMRDEAKEIATR
jgi:hypothetical protein